MAPNEIDKILQKPDQLKLLREFMANHYEMSESQLSQTIDAHISAMKQIEDENKKKTEAIEQEDFEMASKCKKVIDSLKTKLLSPQSIQDLLKKKPILTL